MSELEAAYRGFSSPLEPFNTAFLNAVTVGHARQVTRRFLDRFAPRIEKRSDGLVAALKEWTSGDSTFEDVWDPAFGRLRAALESSGPSRVTDRAVSAVLRLHERGRTGEWEARLDCAGPIRIGRFVLPAADRLRVRADGRRLQMVLGRGARSRSLTLPQSTETAEGIRGVEVLATTKAADSRIIVLRRRALDASEFSEDLPRVDRSPDSIVGPLDAALRLIARHSPAYLAWIRRVVRQVLPQADDPAMITSSSAAWRPGVLYSANRPDPAALVEMLIHEATHQYMYILRQLGPLDDGSDDALPLARPRNDEAPRRDGRRVPRGRQRHALLPGLPAGSRLRPRETERSFAAALPAYEEVLRASRALTPIGRALWRPLETRLHSGGAADRVSAAPGRGRARKAGSGNCRSRTSRWRTGRRTSYRTARRRGRVEQTPSKASSGR